MKEDFTTSCSLQHFDGARVCVWVDIGKRGLTREVLVPVLDGSPAASRGDVDQPA